MQYDILLVQDAIENQQAVHLLEVIVPYHLLEVFQSLTLMS